MRFFRLILAITLLPLCVAATLGGIDLLRSLADSKQMLLPPMALWLLAGIFCWLLVWQLLPKPVRAYVMGHELTHALWGLLFGARVRDLRVTVNGGSVRLSKSNLLITLAPYFFPFYTVVVLLLRWLTGLFIYPVPLPVLWVFLTGFTWCFHACFTIQSLLVYQPDIQEYGRLFSYVIIYLLNVAGTLFWVACITSATLRDAVIFFAQRVVQAYIYVAKVATYIAGTLLP